MWGTDSVLKMGNYGWGVPPVWVIKNNRNNLMKFNFNDPF